jgi:Carboxypeptidase regulatory-like domain
MIDDPRFARQVVPIDTDGPAESKPVTMAVMPAKIIKGRIPDADDGKPIPHAQVRILSYEASTIASTVDEFEADADGRFRANPLSADRYEVSATAPEGQPKLGASNIVQLAEGGSRVSD